VSTGADSAAPPAPARRLLLVRHGLPDYRGGQRGDEIPGPPLSAIGWMQARQAARAVQPYAPQAVYTSPLVRAQQTAACIAECLAQPVRPDGALREWHRTERLYDVSARVAGWLVRWLRSGEACAVAVSHASPLLALLRSALYLPHVGWYRTGHPERLEISSADRFEVSMASVFELAFEPTAVTARCLFHPQPRVLSVWNRRTLTSLPRPVAGDLENRVVRRPNWVGLVGYGVRPARG